MSQKRILLIHDDRILTNLYSETLQAQGHIVHTTRTLNEALKVTNGQENRPDLILTDLILQEGVALNFIESTKGAEATKDIPILIIPKNPISLVQGAQQLGAIAIIEGGQPLASVVNAVNKVSGLPPLDEGTAALMKPSTAWIDAVLGVGQEALNQMRVCLPGLVSATVDTSFLQTLWALVHDFTTRMEMTTLKSAAEIGEAFSLLVMELNESPEQVNPGVVRTIGQALDALTLLLSQRNNQTVLKTAKEASVLVVDDEDGARQIINAALNMAHIKTESVATPEEALQKLENYPANLMILDVGLPGMSGFDLCTKIRSMDAHKKTPVLFLTGMNTFQNKAKASLSGGNDFIGKPFNLPELCLKALIWFYRGQLGKV